MAKPTEIYQVNQIEELTEENVKKALNELNIALFAISQRLPERPIPYWTERSGLTGDDFVLADFTTDGEWHELDLSSILPEDAKLIDVYVHIQDNLVGNFFTLKSYGEVNSYNVIEVHSEVANTENDTEGFLYVGDKRIIQYKATDTVFTNIKLTIRGYWSW